jgi:WD40 repeat protein
MVAGGANPREDGPQNPTALEGRRNDPAREPAGQSASLGYTLPDPSQATPGRTNKLEYVFADDTGEHFATIDTQGRLTLWHEGRTPQHLTTIRSAGSDAVRRVFFSPDGRWMVNAGDDNTARVWDLATGTERFGISERVHQVSFSQDGERMVTHGTQRWITTWELAEGRKLKVLKGHSRVATAMSLGADGRLAVSAEEGGRVRVWSAGLGREVGRGRSWVWSVAYSPDGRLIAECPYHEGVVIRSARSGRELLRIHPPNEWFCGIMFSPDSGRLVTVGNQKMAKVWDAETGQPLLRLRGHRHQIMWSVAYSPDGRWIATGGSDNMAKLWDARTRQERRTFFMDPAKWSAPWKYTNSVKVGFDAKSERLLTLAQYDGYAKVWDIATGALLGGLVVAERGLGVDAAPCLLPDQRRLVIGAGSQIRIFDVATGRLVTETTGRGRNNVDGVSADGRRMVTTTSEMFGWERMIAAAFGQTVLEIWDIEGTPRRLLALSEGEGLVWPHFSPDGRSLVSGSLGFNTYRWESFPWSQEARRLHLLLGSTGVDIGDWTTVPKTYRREVEGTVIGRLVLHYADGETRSLDLVYGRDVRDWWYDPAKVDAEPTDRAKVVWTGTNPVASLYGRRLRLYLNTRENPRPGVKITTFDFVSTMTTSAPFLIAVTVE